MANSNRSTNGFLGLIVLVVIVVGILYLKGVIGGKKPITHQLPNLNKTVFINLTGNENGKRKIFKGIINTDKTGSITDQSLDNATWDGSWAAKSQDSAMIKIVLNTREGSFLVTLYKNAEATVNFNRYQLIGTWYQ